MNTVLISLIVAGDPAAGLAKGTEVNDKDYLDGSRSWRPRTRVCSRDTAASTSRPVPDIPDPNAAAAVPGH